MQHKVRDEAVGEASACCRRRSVAMMALGRMTVGQGDAGETEGERQDSRNGKNIPLQKHLPTDSAG
jgi:hypothetical protein